MKKKIIISLVLALVAVCIFAISVSAKEYSPKTTEELNAALAEITSSSEDNVIYLGGEGANYTTGTVDDGFEINCTGKLTINLVSDIALNCRWKITGGDVVFNLNKFKSKNTSSRGASVGSQFFMNNADSTLEVYNGTIEIEDVCFWPQNGDIIAENVTFTSKEETVWTDGAKTTGNLMHFKSCIINANLFCMHKGGCFDADGVLYRIDDCKFNTNVMIDCPKEGSYFKNSTVTGYLQVDSYHKHNNSNIDTMTIENVTVKGNFSQTSGGVIVNVMNSKFADVSVNGDGTVKDAHMQMIDCTYTSIAIGDKSSKTTFTDIKTATCESAGSKTVYTSKDLIVTVDEQYALDNPALGHIVENPTGVHYANYFEMGAYTGICKHCNADTEESTPSVPAFVENKGFSTFNDNGKLSASQTFRINKEVAILLGEDCDYGIMAMVNQGTSELNPQLDDAGVVSASLTGSGFVATSIKLTNITNADQKIIYCMYLKVGENLVYLNNGTTSDKIVGLSYNDVEAILSK